MGRVSTVEPWARHPPQLNFGFSDYAGQPQTTYGSGKPIGQQSRPAFNRTCRRYARA